MSVFAEPLAQARAYIKLRRITRARSEALAALDLIEQRAADMEEALRRIAGRYCLHTKGDAWEESECLHKPPEEWCSVCIARAVLSAREEARSTVVSYEFDGEGRAYSRHANGEVLPTGYVARSFAGKSDVTPQRFQEIRGEEAQT